MLTNFSPKAALLLAALLVYCGSASGKKYDDEIVIDATDGIQIEEYDAYHHSIPTDKILYRRLVTIIIDNRQHFDIGQLLITDDHRIRSLTQDIVVLLKRGSIRKKMVFNDVEIDPGQFRKIQLTVEINRG